MVKQYRFTVYTQDSKDIAQMAGLKREFIWRINMGQIAKVEMSIESIHCRDMSHVLHNGLTGNNEGTLDNVIDAVKTLNPPGFYNVQIANALGNTDEKELYSIRCTSVNSRYCWDSRPQKYKGASLIYNGSLNFKNTNPEKSFCFDVDGDIANSDFTLFIDNNFYDGVENISGIKDQLEVAVTFILFIDSDDDKK